MSSPTIIALAQSPAWISLIKRSFPSAKLSWALTANSLVDELGREFGAAAIVELFPDTAHAVCKDLFRLRNNSQSHRLFAIGGPELATLRSELTSMGFAGVYPSALAAGRMLKEVTAHHRSVRPRILSIEERVWADLPWPSATSDRAD